MIVEHISYDTIEWENDSTIFTAEKNMQSFDKAFLAKKSIQDYVFTMVLQKRVLKENLPKI